MGEGEGGGEFLELGEVGDVFVDSMVIAAYISRVSCQNIHRICMRRGEEDRLTCNDQTSATALVFRHGRKRLQRQLDVLLPLESVQRQQRWLFSVIS